MTAGVEREGQRKYRAWCERCSDGINTSRQVDAHIWASEHNRTRHMATEATSDRRH